jgi:hypothetical protein
MVQEKLRAWPSPWEPANNPAMKIIATLRAYACAAALAVTAAGPVSAAEGMWTFDNFPAARVKAELGVDIDKTWLDRVQASAVRLTSGCSASLVSGEGLVLTNHHCVRGCAQNLSTSKNDFIANGFMIAARTEERTCPGMQAEVLLSQTDVTADVQAALRGVAANQFSRARDAAFARLESQACAGDATLRCQALAFYGGGQYKLLKYRKYSDVRLVFAPENATASFGGDPDNFNFPRYDLDASFVRLYQNGKPALTPQHLTWSTAAPKAGEAVFVVGNPGSTERMLTSAQLETQRNLVIPVGQLQRSELRGRLIQFSEMGPEQHRVALAPLFSTENSFKVYYGRQMTLNEAEFMAGKRRAEEQLRAQVRANPQLAARIGDPWGELEKIQPISAEQYLVYRQLEANAGGTSTLFDYARTLVRAAQERTKPAAERLVAYSDARLPLVEKQLLDPKPVPPQLERLYLSYWLSKTREYLTVDSPASKLLLGKDSPEALAAQLVAGSKLADPKVREALWKGGIPAIQASSDPMIQFVLKMDPAARAAREAWEREVSGPTERAASRIGDARFALLGQSVYPDANNTLRISYGKVEGWSYRGTDVAPFTYIGGLYERATGAEPFKLTPRWIAAEPRLDKRVVFDFSSSNDIIGGNSGSPVVNAKGEVLGAAFDGNIHSLGGAYGYDPRVNRMVTVSTAAITEALNKVYGRTALVAELTGR